MIDINSITIDIINSNYGTPSTDTSGKRILLSDLNNIIPILPSPIKTTLRTFLRKYPEKIHLNNNYKCFFIKTRLNCFPANYSAFLWSQAIQK